MTPSAAVAEPRDEEAGGGGRGGKIRAGVDAREEPRPPTSNTERSSAPRFRRKTIRDSEVLLQSGTTQQFDTTKQEKSPEIKENVFSFKQLCLSYIMPTFQRSPFKNVSLY